MQFSLKDIYKDYFLIGAAVSADSLDDHKELILKHFNSITCENAMKFGIIHPQRDRYCFEDADKIYTFARSNNIAVRGHNFVWHQEVPDWLFNGTDKERLSAVLDRHIKTLAERYPEIYCWDIINEGLDDGKDEFYRKTPWFEAFGEEYFKIAFETAAKYLKGKTLFYNDYNEFDPVKRDKYLSLIKKLKSEGVPVSGVGLQCHLGLNHAFDLDEIKEGIEQYAKLGMKLHITELDVSLYPYEDRRPHEKPTYEEYKKQTEVYRSVFKIFREYKNEIEAVTLWGVSDDVCWLNHFPAERRNGGLLFDEKQTAKECFYAVCDF